MITRIFYPVGQGAFYSEKHKVEQGYSEKHKSFNIVYDCGTDWSGRKKKKFDTIVRQAFSKDETIDILFISHFDYDHISKISLLRESVKEIKRVIMPLLHKNERILLKNFYRGLGFDDTGIFDNPNKFFKEGTRVFYIKPYDGPTDNNDKINLSKDIDYPQEINSGSKFTLYNSDWIFIPYNFKFDKNEKSLKEKLQQNDFNISKMQNDPDYILNLIESGNIETRKKIRQIYNELEGRINVNSMFLYSGPEHGNTYSRINNNRGLDPCYLPGCIYTGDGDLNKVEIYDVFKDYFKNVGTIQVPHHGAENSFNTDFLKDSDKKCRSNNKTRIYPISFGKENPYNHPSLKVMQDIVEHENYPVLITDDFQSIYFETIIRKPTEYNLRKTPRGILI